MVPSGTRLQQGSCPFILLDQHVVDILSDCYSIPDRYQVWSVRDISEGRTRRDHEAGIVRVHVWPPWLRLIVSQAKRFARAMHASLIFCSTSASINVQKIFKIVLAKAFDLKCVIPEIEGVGEPILMYVDVWLERCVAVGMAQVPTLKKYWKELPRYISTIYTILASLVILIPLTATL